MTEIERDPLTDSTSSRSEVRPRAWLEVDLDALVRNARRLAGLAGHRGLLPMIKADAYGLGAVEVARALRPLQPYGFGVATLDEARELRAAGVEERIIVFFPWIDADAEELCALEVDVAILGLRGLRLLGEAAARAGARPQVHLEIDSGMGRSGLLASEAGEWAPRVAEALAAAPMELASVFTHFQSGDDDVACAEQLGRFGGALSALAGHGVEAAVTHVANSDAAIRDPQYHPGLVRPGIYLYGGRRGAGIAEALEDPEPVACVRARVIEVRELPPGSSVGYGATYTTPGTERVATLAIGYADGVPWRLSNRGQAIVGGVRVPIRGSVCMDVTLVDVSGMPGVEPGTAVTLLGRDGDEVIELREWAEMGGTIEYELLTGLKRRLPRFYAGTDTSERNR